MKMVLTYEGSIEPEIELSLGTPDPNEKEYWVEILIHDLEAVFFISRANSHLEALWRGWLQYRLSTYPQTDIIAGRAYGCCTDTSCPWLGEIHYHHYSWPPPSSE